MNPSYNNLGGFGSGGTVPPAPAPAAPQPQQPQPQFQPQQPIMSPQQPAPISSGTGDIVLAPEKKSHKGIIVAIILAILVIGGLLAMMFVMSKGGGSVNISNDAKLAFNKYANYLLYGEDSDKALEGEYDENEIYKLDEMRDEDAQVVTNYFKTANELLSNFESFTNGNTNNDFITAVDDYRADFELVRLTFNKEYISEEELASMVLANNLEDTKTWIANKYANLTKSGYEKVKKYAESEINYYQLYAECLEKAKAAGCLNAEDGIVCDFSDETLESQIDDASEEASKMALSADHNVLRGCWEINKFLNGEVKNAE